MIELDELIPKDSNGSAILTGNKIEIALNKAVDPKRLLDPILDPECLWLDMYYHDMYRSRLAKAQATIREQAVEIRCLNDQLYHLGRVKSIDNDVI